MRKFFVTWAILFGAALQAASPEQTAFDQALAANDFAAALKISRNMNTDERDAALAKLAMYQRRSGDYPGAASSAGQISNPAKREESIVGGSGGGGAADFSSLMQLIQSTIEPDTWQDNGGNSRMEPYPGGILVDPSGLVKNVRPEMTTAARSKEVSDLAARGLRQPRDLATDPNTWRRASAARSVSLRNLQTMLAGRLSKGHGPDEVMSNLAGLTRLYAVLVPDDLSDVILVGEVGELEQRVAYGWCDQITGRTTLRLEDLTAMLSAVDQNHAIGCSIDPTANGLASVQTVATQIREGKLKGTAATKALATSLGNQQITLIGMAADEPASLAFVIADRHMKMLALGEVDCPKSIRNYFAWTEEFLDKNGLPDGQLLRMWFTGLPVDVDVSRNRRAWSWDRTPIQLLSEKQMADAMGQRRAAGQDPRAEAFAKQMTEHFSELPQAEPIYGRLAGLFELALGLGLAKQGMESNELWTPVVGLLGASDGWQQRLPQPPRMVTSLVANHTIKRGRKQHLVTVISGGIEVRPNELAKASKISASSAADELRYRGIEVGTPNRWWWDHTK